MIDDPPLSRKLILFLHVEFPTCHILFLPVFYFPRAEERAEEK